VRSQRRLLRAFSSRWSMRLFHRYSKHRKNRELSQKLVAAVMSVIEAAEMSRCSSVREKLDSPPEGLDPVAAHVEDKLTGAGVIEVQVLQPGKVPSELAGVGAGAGRAVHRLIGEVPADVVKDPVHDDVDVAVVALADESLEPRSFSSGRPGSLA
jgi:hypothetical protein